MKQVVTTVIPHQLGEEEARQRIKAGFDRLKRHVSGGPMGIDVTQHWIGDRLNFEGTALGQSMTGRIEVRPDVVQIEVDLPPLLGAVAKMLTTKLNKETKKLLEKRRRPL